VDVLFLLYGDRDSQSNGAESNTKYLKELRQTKTVLKNTEQKLGGTQSSSVISIIMNNEKKTV